MAIKTNQVVRQHGVCISPTTAGAKQQWALGCLINRVSRCCFTGQIHSLTACPPPPPPPPSRKRVSLRPLVRNKDFVIPVKSSLYTSVSSFQKITDIYNSGTFFSCFSLRVYSGFQLFLWDDTVASLYLLSPSFPSPSKNCGDAFVPGKVQRNIDHSPHLHTIKYICNNYN